MYPFAEAFFPITKPRRLLIEKLTTEYPFWAAMMMILTEFMASHSSTKTLILGKEDKVNESKRKDTIRLYDFTSVIF